MYNFTGKFNGNLDIMIDPPIERPYPFNWDMIYLFRDWSWGDKIVKSIC